MSQQVHNNGRKDQDSDLKLLLERVESIEELQDIGTGEADENGSDRLTEDDVFEILYNQRRREILRYLREADGTVTTSDLAEHIAAQENNTTPQQLSSSERKRVYVGLYQNHLPKMADYGVIEYEKNRGNVSLCECSKQLEPYLEEPVGSSTPVVKLVSVIVLGLVILAGVTNVGPLVALPDTLWLGVGLIGLVVLITIGAIDAETLSLGSSATQEQ